MSVGVCRLLGGVESCKPMSSVSWGSGQLCLLSLPGFSGDFLPRKYIAGLRCLSVRNAEIAFTRRRRTCKIPGAGGTPGQGGT